MRLLVLLVLVKDDEVDGTYSMAVVVVVFVDIVDDDGADFFSKGQYC